MSKIDGLLLYDPTSEPLPDLGRCGSCGWKGPVSECEMSEESDGWENPSYLVHLCPNCEDGAIDDYYFSSKCFAEWERWKKEYGDDPYDDL